MGALHKTTALGVLVVCAACGRSPPQPVATPLRAPPPAPAPAAAVAPGPRPHQAPPADPCAPLGPGEVSDDETPSLAGGSGRATAGAWLEARGVSRDAFRAWVRSRSPNLLEDFDADTLFDGEGGCETLKVGDGPEDALLCPLAVRTSILRFLAVAFVVRDRRIAPVLELGYGLTAMDWPDARWLDLQLVFSPDGLSADLHNRAAPGAVLVRSPRACHEHFARYLACERAHAEGTPPIADVCPQQLGQGGALSYGHHTPTPPPSPMGVARVPLQGCAAALPKLDALVAESGSGNPYAREFRDDRAFAVKSCNARGRYVWKGGRFVRTATGGL